MFMVSFRRSWNPRIDMDSDEWVEYQLAKDNMATTVEQLTKLRDIMDYWA